MALSVQIESIRPRHEAVADWLLANPSCKNLQQLCDAMSLSRSHLSIIMQSDVWKDYWARRRRAWEDQFADGLQRQQFEVARKAYERLDVILSDDETDPRLVFDIANRTAEALRSGRPKTTVIDERVQELSVPVDSSILASARETFRRRVITEHDALPAPTSSESQGG